MAACQPDNVSFDWSTDGQVTITWDMQNDACVNNGVGAAVYSYEDTGPATFSYVKPQTLLDSDTSFALEDESVTLQVPELCGVDFQVDLFRGNVLDDVPTHMYGARLFAADHEDGEECEATTTTASTSTTVQDPTTTTTEETTTTTSSSTTSTAPADTTTTTEDPATTTSSSVVEQPTTTTTEANTPLNPGPGITYSCEDEWIEDNRDIAADGFIEPWEVALDGDGDGIACEVELLTASVADPTTSTSTLDSLPFTGNDPIAAVLGLSILAAGVACLVPSWRRRMALRKV